ncbi:MAG: hypothetical protein PQJ59_16925 [Spirochaetales bacterium]|nr:hypothetical protein [Spirochaetales bacterium]
MFRAISEKAWLVNTIIGHLIDKVTPYMRPQKTKAQRYFSIELKDPDAKMSAKDRKRAKEIQEFFMKTGWDNSLQHEDDLIHYTKKIVRDLLTLDQVAAEKLWSRGGDLLSFEAVDAATILRCNEEGYEGDDKIRFVQMMDNQVVSQYTGDQMIFQFQNPRTDVNHFGYGYSKVEQAVNLIVALIHSFVHNAGNFTDDKLPRGMILMEGDIGFEELEEIEDYIVDMMAPNGVGGAMNKWGIPIIPTGKGGDKSTIKWQPLGSSNRDMEYSQWQDYLNMGTCALYGVDMESMGFKSDKSAKIMESGSAEGRKYSDDKGVGNILTFLERHFQSILDHIDPKFEFIFHGFEQDDAKESREGLEFELKTFKSLNEVRKEKDMDPLDPKKFPFADIPGLQNPQILQAYNATLGGEEEGGEPEEDQEDDWNSDDWGKSLEEDDVIRIVI